MCREGTSIRLQRIMNERGLRQVDIIELAKPYCIKYNVKLGRNDLSQYVSGKVEPSQKKLTVLSKALNVSEVWLMGYDIESNAKTELAKILDTLNEQGQEEILKHAKYVASQNIYKKCSMAESEVV